MADITQTVPGHREPHFLPNSQQQWPPPKVDLQTEKQRNPLREGMRREGMLDCEEQQTQRKGKLKVPSVMSDLYDYACYIKSVIQKLKGGGEHDGWSD